MTNETFKLSHARIMLDLAQQGWQVKAGLKVPHSTSPTGEVRFWFKPQAVWASVGNSHNLAGARSTWIDIRGLSTTDFLKLAAKGGNAPF